MKRITEEDLSIIINKQFEINGIRLDYDWLKEYAKINQGWYGEFITTQEEENEFRKFLIGYFRESKKFNKSMYEKLAGEIILNYGFKLKPRFVTAWGLFQNSGWRKIVSDMITEISIHLMRTGNDKFRITYLKEKYGSLRVEYNSADDTILDIINKYEELSETTCIECGAEGKIDSSKAWLKPLCDKCKSLGK